MKALANGEKTCRNGKNTTMCEILRLRFPKKDLQLKR